MTSPRSRRARSSGSDAPQNIGGRAGKPCPRAVGAGSLSPPPLVAHRRGALVAQIPDHRRNIEIIAEIAGGHRSESSTAVGLRKTLSKKGRIVDLSFRSDL